MRTRLQIAAVVLVTGYLWPVLVGALSVLALTAWLAYRLLRSSAGWHSVQHAPINDDPRPARGRDPAGQPTGPTGAR